MGRLTQIKGRLATVKVGRISQAQGRREVDQRRNAQAWRRWYGLARWKRLRWDVLVRDRFTCRMCQRVEPDTSKLVADHVRPHRGDPALFWDQDNLQSLCASCHSSAKQAAEAREF